ncbi:hypothetical protein N7491_004142 [Penicillium cf. griseofulvum]|uniref:Uncharacterized protein n=1 Tax=Penicillium cf. griseofulvum TaxID=2972120 RepID=A0A9W9T0T5_9EURO|nr:hypothetical protein N7472_001682 [Penicillium cf. griseofulvum]KAJ5437589.1 hypothetical protein N7445_006133 [Penicillium cf. griseofulvum]KAJ5441736.1 hypothetical protein N7491_004142 [Penicillium cf. griseofulvum]
MSDPRLIDMEPGGESTQYESIRQYTKSPSKQTGQLGVHDKHTKTEATPPLGEQGTPSYNDEDFQAQKLGMGVFADSSKDITHDEEDAGAKARRLQGYGPGSGVGA